MTAPTLAAKPTTTTYYRPFNLRPVVATGALRATHRTAYASYCYIRREPDADAFGPMPVEWATRDNLIATGRVRPAQTPAWARSGAEIWHRADASLTPHNAAEAVALHIVLTLPPSLEPDDWQHLVETFAGQELATKGMIADWAIHHKPDAIAPHAHLLVTARGWRNERTPGQRHERWLRTEDAIRGAERAWIALSGLRPVPVIGAAA